VKKLIKIYADVVGVITIGIGISLVVVLVVYLVNMMIKIASTF